jgi:hypothetical protein
MLCTVKEASRYVGEIGHIRVTEASIRGYLHRGRLAYRAGTMIRLGTCWPWLWMSRRGRARRELLALLLVIWVFIQVVA